MATSPKPPKVTEYARLPALRKAMDDMRKLELDVAAVELAPGGVIRILTSKAFPSAPKDEFEAWEQSGRLG